MPQSLHCQAFKPPWHCSRCAFAVPPLYLRSNLASWSGEKAVEEMGFSVEKAQLLRDCKMLNHQPCLRILHTPFCAHCSPLLHPIGNGSFMGGTWGALGRHLVHGWMVKSGADGGLGNVKNGKWSVMSELKIVN